MASKCVCAAIVVCRHTVVSSLRNASFLCQKKTNQVNELTIGLKVGQQSQKRLASVQP